MATAAFPLIATKTNLSSAEYHKKAAECHYEAAKHHSDAAKHHESGNHQEAIVYALRAYWYHGY
jgi:hypothetical protein